MIKGLKPYKRKVQYYETDQMGIVHHSNYIRWFEETRTDMLEQAGMGFEKIEQAGIISPILAVECKYINPVRYGEEVIIYPYLEKFNGVKCIVKYEVKGEKNNDLKVVGSTEVGFVDKEYKPVRMKKYYPEIYKVFNDMLENSVQSE